MKNSKLVVVSALLLTLLAVCCLAIPLFAAETEADYLFLSDLQDQIVADKTVKGEWIGYDGFFDASRDKNLAGGYKFKKGITMHGAQAPQNWICSQTWDISQYSERYDVFTATIGKYDVAANRNTIVIIEVDGVEKYNSGSISVGYLEHVEIDIKDAQELTLKVDADQECNADMVVFAYASIAKKSEIKIKSLEIAGLSSFALQGEDLDLSKGIVLVTYNNNTFEEIPLTDEGVSVSGYQKENTGKQSVAVSYGGQSVEKEIAVMSADSMAYVADMTWETSTAYSGINGGKSSNSGVDHLGCRIQIAGRPVYKPIYTCPLNVKVEADSYAGISVNLEEMGYEWLRGFAGRTYASSNVGGGSSKYYIMGDGEVLAQSEDIYIGDVWEFCVNIKDVKELKLLVSIGGDNSINGDFSAFADTVLYKGERDIFEEETDPPTQEPTAEPTKPATAPETDGPADSTGGADKTEGQTTDVPEGKGCSSAAAVGVVAAIALLPAACVLFRRKKR